MPGPRYMRRLLAVVVFWPTLALAEPASLSENRPVNAPDRVEVLLEVGGDMTLMEEGKPRSLKMSVVGNFRYDEKLLIDTLPHRRGLRQYERAEASIKIEQGALKPTLRDDRRTIQLDLESDHLTAVSPQGPLTREELDLINTPADSLLIGRLLPDRDVDTGDQWPAPEAVLAPLLSIDVVQQSDIVCELKSLDANLAKVEFNGTVAGGVGGVATDLEVKGRYKFDRSLRRITWLAMVVKEKRAVGHVSPGLNVVARVQMTIIPGVENSSLEAIGLQELAETTAPEALDLTYQSTFGRWRFQHGRDWHVMNETKDGAALRFVDRGELVAQCNVASLIDAARGQAPTLEQFQKDVEKALGESFRQFASASTSARGSASSEMVLTIHHVSVLGEASEVPMQWNYYLICDEQSGRQTVLAFTVEQNLIERLGDAERALVDSFEFVPLSNDPAAATAQAQVRSIGAAAPLPADPQTPAPVRLQLR